jgi:carboxyl-terminal processing protease
MRTALKLGVVTVGIVLVLLVGIRLGSDPSNLPGPLRDVASNSQTAGFNEAMGLIEKDYYRKIPSTDVQNAGIAGAVALLRDRFSAYLDPREYKAFEHSQNPHFSGIGMDVDFAPKGLKVNRVFANSPAEKAGIKAGETITAVNGKSLAGKGVGASVALVTGPPGSPVQVTVSSAAGASRTLTIKRATIVVPSVESKLITAPGGRKVGVVALSGFVQGAGGQVANSVRALIKNGAQAIVLDLRGNGGGLIDEAVAVASVFIETGPIVVTKGRNRPREQYDASGGAIKGSIPVVVLVDHNSASASEIVAGAIQDSHRGVVVGTRTFGKGVFQEITELVNGGALDITVGEFFTPSGRNLGGGGVKTGAGITPNVQVPPAAGPAAALNQAVAQAAGRIK